jgi:FkbM family methyltransferase
MANLFLSSAAWLARRLPEPVKRNLYRIPVLSKFIRASLNRAAPHGKMVVEVAAGGLEGWQMELDLQAEKDYWLGTYESELQAAVKELVQPGAIVYDVGANIGYVSLLLARQVGPQGQVFAFEALPENLERLRRNVALNPSAQVVQVVAVAVVDNSGPVQFLVGSSGSIGKAKGSAGRENITYSDSVLVSGVSLDQFVYQQHHPQPQVIKIDIEGGEVLALPGMLRLLQEARPVVLLELHGPEAARSAWITLVGAGYQVCRMQPGFPAVSSLEALDWKAYVVALPAV